MEKELADKMNNLGTKIDIVSNLTSVLVDSMCNNCNITEKDSKNLAHLLKNRIKNIKFRYEEIIRELKI